MVSEKRNRILSNRENKAEALKTQNCNAVQSKMADMKRTLESHPFNFENSRRK